jgi:hypothetical protein
MKSNNNKTKNILTIKILSSHQISHKLLI